MHKSIDQWVSYHAKHTPNRLAFRFLQERDTPEVTVTFVDLEKRAMAMAAYLQERGLSGKRVMLCYPFGVHFVYAFLACLYANVIPMPISLPRFNRENTALEQLVLSAKPSVFLSTKSVVDQVITKWDTTHNLRSIPWIATDSLDLTLYQGWEPQAKKGEDIALIQFTSGSTSQPKGVVISHNNIMANQVMIQKAFEHQPGISTVGWLPMYHDMGLIGNMMQGLYVGYTITLLSPVSFIQKPIRWLQAISDYQAVSSGGPNFAYSHCVNRISIEDTESIDLSSWTLAFNGSEPIHAQTLDLFSEKFSILGFKKTAFYPCYGLAEATLIVSGGFKSAEPITLTCDTELLKTGQIKSASISENSTTLVGSGHSLLEGDLHIVNPEYQIILPDGEIGEIWISGKNVAKGYWSQDTFDTAAFTKKIKNKDGSFYATGDLGALINGELFVTGRIKELIIIAGKNHYPQDLELTVKKIDPAFNDYSTVAFSVPQDLVGEAVVIIQELRRFPDEMTQKNWIQAIRSAIFLQHELAVKDVVFVALGIIEKTSSGKLKRQKCRADYLNDFFKKEHTLC